MPEPVTRRTDEAGRVAVSGWLGEYRVSAQRRAVGFSLEVGAGDLEVRLGR